MKRDIKINYGKIEEIIYNISKYESALEDMESSLKSIHQQISNSTGESINALLENYEVLTRNIDICKEELRDLRKILSDYINEMSRYAQAIDRGRLIRVDRNDVWWNIKSMEGVINQITDEQLRWGYNYSGSWSSDKDVIRREEYNGSQIDTINHIVEKYVKILNEKVQEIYAIHNNKIIPFENTDDAFRDKAWNMYWKCTGLGDWIEDFFGFLDKSLNNIIDGVLKGLTDLVIGLAQLAIGAVKYVGSCAVVVLCEPFGGAPDWAKNKVNEDNELISSILKDPALIVEGIAQDASDAIDEKGICYSAGYLGGTFLGTKGLDKIAKGVKGLISGGKAATINSLDDIAIYGLNSLDDIIEKAGIKSVDDLTRIGVTSSEDLAKLGVNSVDDLARLGINNIDELSKLGILPEDLSKAGIKGVRQPVSVNANEIRFSQSSVNGADEIISSMKANGWKGDPIDVIKMSDGKLTTIDNTRVVAAREAGIDAKAIIHDANEILPENLIDRFTTKKGVPKTWGEAMELRIGKQKASFRNNNPFGADVMERIGK
ncbi:hypothetical protein LAV35_10270 [Clostridium sporogenes]|uniref:hypothetical protein n=1 Tax=Clostridium sporogenes TaxID=1509 RepID=UPI000E195AB0|nr:hypothetical protein [Clostridium sporogenes]MCW6062049.1 hypothetical protein [Clostridium sporogenes]MCW6068571.1 hypothetical protein [Clostridium sporogenes]MDU6337235.1 hypothetical protein [Clostridium sporogenes]SUY62419.1 Uncharacterised protein [Clostridium sporogenes]